ncbi:STAS domain-containing protein [Modestobacter altitudinis]|uniref:STAS domain-containing protein n=1 Tax=Modestobacter altitudinis TaxID=2213158 RepID=UPI001486612C|nr:STAS domain-containing protein [Modestobacter altitudinis]
MVRSSRRSRSGAPVARPSRDAQSLRCRDVAVTCRDRSRGGTADDQPAPRLLAGTGERGGPATVQVAVGAYLVAGRAAEIRSVVAEALGRAPEVLVLRLDEVQRFDAAGIGLLLRLHAQARNQGTAVRCTDAPRQLVAVLHRTRADHVLTLVA